MLRIDIDFAFILNFSPFSVCIVRTLKAFKIEFNLIALSTKFKTGDAKDAMAFSLNLDPSNHFGAKLFCI